jgi:hypothetical protein
VQPCTPIAQASPANEGGFDNFPLEASEGDWANEGFNPMTILTTAPSTMDLLLNHLAFHLLQNHLPGSLGTQTSQQLGLVDFLNQDQKLLKVMSNGILDSSSG